MQTKKQRLAKQKNWAIFRLRGSLSVFKNIRLVTQNHMLNREAEDIVLLIENFIRKLKEDNNV